MNVIPIQDILTLHRLNSLLTNEKKFEGPEKFINLSHLGRSLFTVAGAEALVTTCNFFENEFINGVKHFREGQVLDSYTQDFQTCVQTARSYYNFNYYFHRDYYDLHEFRRHSNIYINKSHDAKYENVQLFCKILSNFYIPKDERQQLSNGTSRSRRECFYLFSSPKCPLFKSIENFQNCEEFLPTKNPQLKKKSNVVELKKEEKKWTKELTRFYSFNELENNTSQSVINEDEEDHSLERTLAIKAFYEQNDEYEVRDVKQNVLDAYHQLVNSQSLDNIKSKRKRRKQRKRERELNEARKTTLNNELKQPEEKNSTVEIVKQGQKMLLKEKKINVDALMKFAENNSKMMDYVDRRLEIEKTQTENHQKDTKTSLPIHDTAIIATQDSSKYRKFLQNIIHEKCSNTIFIKKLNSQNTPGSRKVFTAISEDY